MTHNDINAIYTKSLRDIQLLHDQEIEYIRNRHINEIELLNSIIKDKDNTIEELNTRYKSFNEDLKKKHNNHIRELIQTHKLDIQKRIDTEHQLRDTIRDLERKNEAVNKDKISKLNEIKSLEKKHDELMHRCQQQQHTYELQMDNERKKYKSTLNVLEKTIQELNERLSSYQKNISKRDADYKALEQQMKSSIHKLEMEHTRKLMALESKLNAEIQRQQHEINYWKTYTKSLKQ